jgi:hypothetical protein
VASNYRIKNHGVLLVEALISFGLMFTVALTVFGLQAQAHRARYKARNMIAATSFARQLLEEARDTSYDELSLGESKQERVVEFDRDGKPGKAQFFAVVEVRPGPLDDTKSVAVNVTWTSGKVDLETYVRK